MTARKIVFLGIGAGVIWYFFLRGKAAPITDVAISGGTITPAVPRP